MRRHLSKFLPVFSVLLILVILIGAVGGCGGPATPAQTPTLTLTPSITQPTSPTPFLTPVMTPLPSSTQTATPAITPAATPPATPTTPLPAKFEVTSLSVTPDEIVAGEQFTVKASIKNVGEVQGTYSANLKVDDLIVDTKDITVSAGKTETVSFTRKIEIAGTHTVQLDSSSYNFTVLKTGKLQVKSVVVEPKLILSGQTAKVEAVVENAGEAKGTFRVTLKVNGMGIDGRLIDIAAAATDKVSFTVVRDIPGSYDISVEGVNATLTVAEAESYQNEEYLYSISYPKGWTLDESTPERVSISIAGQAALGVTINTMPVGATIAEHYAFVMSWTRQTYPDIKELSRSEIREGGSVVCYDAEFAYTYQGARIKMHMVLSKSGRWGFARWGETLEANYEQNKPLLDACLESFKPPVVAVGSYSNSSHGFLVTLPSGWDSRETGENTPFLTILNRVGDPPVITYIFIERLYEDISAKDYASKVASSLSQQKDYKVISERNVALGQATQGYEIVFTYTYKDNYSLKYRIVSIVRGTQVFTLMVSTLAQTYDNMSGTIDQLISSFTLQEPKPFGVSRQNALFLYQGEIITLDPALDSPGEIVGSIFSGLVKMSKDMKAVPDIAKSWEVSPDGRVYTFHLREGAKFHNGKPVTAWDFKYSWERACDPKTDSKSASTYMGDITGAKEMLSGKAQQISGVKVVDELTLQVTIDGPKPYFIDKLTYQTAFVVDRINIAQSRNWAEKPNGTGPFKLKEWKKDELLILERNDNYYLEQAKLNNIVFQIYAGRPVMMYERGEIDITGVSLDNLERVLDPQNPLNRELVTTPQIAVQYLGFNVNMPPFDDPKVRQAFALALDINKIIGVSLKGNAERASGFLPPGVPGYNKELSPLPFDPVRAKQLIAESKYKSVDNLPPIVFYCYGSVDPVGEAIIGMWQQNLGVTVEAEAVKQLEDWLDGMDRREFQIFASGWGADYIDPQNFLEVLFHSQSRQNHFDYSNSQVDTALEKAAVEQNKEARLEMYQKIEKMILDDLPAVPLYHSWKSHMLVKPYIEGFYLAPINLNVWKDIAIKPH